MQAFTDGQPLLELAERFPDVVVEVVPGLTAALSGGAVLGAPLAHDFCVLSLSDRLTPWAVIQRRLAAAAMGDFCIALYNPSSKGRPDYLEKAVRILLEHGKPPQTVCGLVRNIGREGQTHRVLTLAQLEHTPVDMFTTVFIGNAETKTAQRPDGYTEGGIADENSRLQRHHRGPHFFQRAGRAGGGRPRQRGDPLGAEEQGSLSGITVHCGRLTPEEMADLLKGADLCVDATHPYAVDATKNIAAACKTAQIEYHRLLRAESPLPAGSMVFQSAMHAAEFLAETQGNVLLATGAGACRLFPASTRRGCSPAFCPRWTASPPVKPLTFPTKTSLRCRGPSPTR